jgi:hypothetical protein
VIKHPLSLNPSTPHDCLSRTEPLGLILIQVSDKCWTSADCGAGRWCFDCEPEFAGSHCVRSTATNSFQLVVRARFFLSFSSVGKRIRTRNTACVCFLCSSFSQIPGLAWSVSKPNTMRAHEIFQCEPMRSFVREASPWVRQIVILIYSVYRKKMS